MTSFNINHGHLKLSVEKLDPCPDIDGYERYRLTAPGLDCILSLDAGYWAKPFFAMPIVAEDYYEKIHYPTQRPFFSDNNTFTNAELRQIAKQIAYGNE